MSNTDWILDTDDKNTKFYDEITVDNLRFILKTEPTVKKSIKYSDQFKKSARPKKELYNKLRLIKKYRNTRTNIKEKIRKWTDSIIYVMEELRNAGMEIEPIYESLNLKSIITREELNLNGSESDGTSEEKFIDY